MTKGEGKAEVIDLKGLRRAGSPVEIEPLGDDEDRKRGSIAARLRRLAHDRLEAGGRLRIGIGCAPSLGDAERLERAEEIGVLLGRHHADKATEAKPGLKGVGAGESGTEQDQEAVEEAVVLDEIAGYDRMGHGSGEQLLDEAMPPACDQPGSLAARRVSVKRSDMMLVPI